MRFLLRLLLVFLMMGVTLVFFGVPVLIILSLPPGEGVLSTLPKDALSYNPQKLVEASVLVATDNGYGSGVCFRNGKIPFIWTAAHVVAGNRYVEECHNQDGKFFRRVLYKDVRISQEIICNGRKAGEVSVLARVIRASDVQDVALLLPFADWPKSSVRFCEEVPYLAQPVWCVGSSRGPRGCNSVSSGVVSAVGRLRSNGVPDEVFRPDIYDQYDVTVHPGNSGCGIFRRDNGHCLGLVIEFLGDDHTYGSVCALPARRMRQFCEKANCEWAMDATVSVPTKDAEHVYRDELPP